MHRSDVFGKTDPFCVLQYGDVKYTTETMKKTYNPVWNDTVALRTTKTSLQPLSLGMQHQHVFVACFFFARPLSAALTSCCLVSSSF